MLLHESKLSEIIIKTPDAGFSLSSNFKNIQISQEFEWEKLHNFQYIFHLIYLK